MKLLVCDEVLNERHKEKITDLASKLGIELGFTSDAKIVPSGFLDADIVYGYGFNLTQAVEIRNSEKLKWAAVTSAGVDFMLKPGMFKNENLLITNSSGSYGVTIAEHIVAVSIMMMRKLTSFYADSLQGKWGHPVLQRNIKGSRIAVLGTGDIGKCFARRIKAFEPESIVGISRSGISEEESFDRMLAVDRLDEVLPETDLLVMSLPETPETKGILSKERINLLPNDAYIVNVGRGSAIDEEALIDALNEGRLAGAALDVFMQEPLPEESPLWHTKNLLITPHVAGNMTTDYTVDINVDMFCENLVNYVEGKPLKNVISRGRGY